MPHHLHPRAAAWSGRLGRRALAIGCGPWATLSPEKHMNANRQTLSHSLVDAALSVSLVRHLQALIARLDPHGRIAADTKPNNIEEAPGRITSKRAAVLNNQRAPSPRRRVSYLKRVPVGGQAWLSMIEEGPSPPFHMYGTVTETINLKATAPSP
jgi:hypothetical protein